MEEGGGSEKPLKQGNFDDEKRDGEKLEGKSTRGGKSKPGNRPLPDFQGLWCQFKNFLRFRGVNFSTDAHLAVFFFLDQRNFTCFAENEGLPFMLSFRENQNAKRKKNGKN